MAVNAQLVALIIAAVLLAWIALDIERRAAAADPIARLREDGVLPRQQHYSFAHDVLPAAMRRDPAALARRLKDGGTVGLHTLWRIAGEAADESSDPAAELRVVVEALDERDDAAGEVLVICLPAPERTTEAHFVALVYPREAKPRLFTLELGHDLEGAERTVLCEWADGRHLNLGDGPKAEIDAFVSAVREELAG